MHNYQIFLGRQPILDREGGLQAYELLFRSGMHGDGNRACILDPTHATATVVANAFVEFPTNEVLGPYRGFINVDHEFLFSDMIEALPPHLAVLEILETVVPTAEVVARCRQLRDKGFTLVLDDVVQVEEDSRPLLALADMIKVDIVKLDDGKLRDLVDELRLFGKKLLAEKVESVEQFDLCKALGFEFFQGYFFAHPVVIVGKKLSPAQVSLLRLLGLIMRDAETSEIENAFKIEPGLVVNLLRLTNSVSSGLSIKVTSLRHAITVLGRQQLQRWLQLLVYTSRDHPGSGVNPLQQLAATRGRLMELLAARAQANDREFSDQAFMVGIMSLMPALLGMTMGDILDQLPFVPRVRQALFGQEGVLGHLLYLAECTEQTDMELIAEACARIPGITTEFLADCLADAMYWANNLGKERERGDAPSD